jgi:hypothetical protein
LIERGIFGETAREFAEPRFLDLRRQRQRQQIAERRGALGGEIGQVHAQRLAGDCLGWIIGEEMHAAHEPVGRQHQIATERRRQDRGIVGKPKRAGMGRERRKEARDHPVLGGHTFCVGAHCLALPRAPSPWKGEGRGGGRSNL